MQGPGESAGKRTPLSKTRRPIVRPAGRWSADSGNCAFSRSSFSLTAKRSRAAREPGRPRTYPAGRGTSGLTLAAGIPLHAHVLVKHRGDRHGDVELGIHVEGDARLRLTFLHDVEGVVDLSRSRTIFVVQDQTYVMRAGKPLHGVLHLFVDLDGVFLAVFGQLLLCLFTIVLNFALQSFDLHPDVIPILRVGST